MEIVCVLWIIFLYLIIYLFYLPYSSHKIQNTRQSQYTDNPFSLFSIHLYIYWFVLHIYIPWINSIYLFSYLGFQVYVRGVYRVYLSRDRDVPSIGAEKTLPFHFSFPLLIGNRGKNLRHYLYISINIIQFLSMVQLSIYLYLSISMYLYSYLSFQVW